MSDMKEKLMRAGRDANLCHDWSATKWANDLSTVLAAQGLAIVPVKATEKMVYAEATAAAFFNASQGE